MDNNMFFDVDGILTEEEAKKFFEENDDEQQEDDGGSNAPENSEEETEETDEGSEGTGVENDNTADEDSNEDSQESVGNGENDDETEEDARKHSGSGSSPTAYSSIAKALKIDGIFPDFSDDEIDSVHTPEDFSNLMEKAVADRVGAEIHSVKEALENGVRPDVITQYAQTLNNLSTYTDDVLKDEGEDSENLRRMLIYNELVRRGYSEERAKKELKKSFDAGTDVEDAIDARESLKEMLSAEYQKIQNDAKAQADARKAAERKQYDNFKKLVCEDAVKVGNTTLDKRTCQKVFDAVTKPVYKDENTGQYLTAVQKYQRENPLEFYKQMGMWFVLTDGGKDFSALTKKQLIAERNKGIRELEHKINTSSFTGGSLRYDGGNSDEGGDDILLSDKWKIAE